MLRPIRSIVMRSSALALCVYAWGNLVVGAASAQERWAARTGAPSVYQTESYAGSSQYGTGAPVPAAVELGAWDGNTPLSQATPVGDGPPAEQWIAAPADRSPYLDTQVGGNPAWDG